MGLPDIDGLQVLKRLREWSDIPVLILTIRDDEKLKVASLEAGADDYITKPFSTAELLARLRVIQRRQHSSGAPEVAVGALRIDFTTQRVSLRGQEVKLTPTEYQLLKSLAFYPGRVITQAQLIRNLWGGSIAQADAALRVHINHLRKKLCAGSSGVEIRNEAALGYRLLVSEAPGLDP
jgi:two-component system KDP operon response regulator KdpE